MTQNAEGLTTVQTIDCPPECVSTILEHDRHADGCRWHEPDLGRTWCAVCRRMQAVVEISTEGYEDLGTEFEATVMRLTCGHSSEGRRTVVGPASGNDSATVAVEQQQTQRRIEQAHRREERGR